MAKLYVMAETEITAPGAGRVQRKRHGQSPQWRSWRIAHPIFPASARVPRCSVEPVIGTALRKSAVVRTTSILAPPMCLYLAAFTCETSVDPWLRGSRNWPAGAVPSARASHGCAA